MHLALALSPPFRPSPRSTAPSPFPLPTQSTQQRTRIFYPTTPPAETNCCRTNCGHSRTACLNAFLLLALRVLRGGCLLV
ncbi:hypothetical protein EJB05_10516 [Eragrostis curvula]|uniref:Uncharacterized protein n=1 Tax=Eragrostis curvula TaxID=38414 RepID=A0A5J9VM37_9POAL|nr:hypothetical protein EJB05_10516 [Eragrostis curvula]